MIVSTFKNIKSHVPINISVIQILTRFKTDDRCNVKSMAAMNKEEYAAAKKNLPVVTFAGTFKKRASKELLHSSGLLTLDFDNVSLKTLKSTLKEKDYIFSYFVSPSGKGIKALCKIPVVKTDAEYKQYYAAISKEYKEIDQSGKDIARACFFCYDPDLYINTDAKAYTLPEQPKKEEKKINVDRSKNDYNILNRICEIIRHAQTGERHNKILKAAHLAGGFVATGIFTQEEAERILIQEADIVNEDWKDNIKTVQDGIEKGMQKPLKADTVTVNKLKEELKQEESVIKFGKIYYTLADVEGEIDELYKNGQQRGFESGHTELDGHFTLKLGTTSYVYGAPYSGKTQVWFELLMCYSEKHGLRHGIFSPETGDASEIYAELIGMYSRKHFYNTYNSQLDLDELQKAKKFVNEHFVIIDPRNNIISHKDFFAYLNEIERVYNTKVHTATIDPFNEFRQDLKGFSNRQDLYLEAVLTEVRENARVYNRHNCIITHVQDQQICTQDGIRFYPLATYREIAGGQAWSRKGMNMMSVWRPKEELKDENGIPFEKNTTIIDIQKSKPKGIGRIGKVQWLYNLNTQRFMSKDYELPNLGESKTEIQTEYSQYKGYDPNCGF